MAIASSLHPPRLSAALPQRRHRPRHWRCLGVHPLLQELLPTWHCWGLARRVFIQHLQSFPISASDHKQISLPKMGDFLSTKKERMKLPAQHPARTRGPLQAPLSPCFSSKLFSSKLFSSRLLQPTLCPSLSWAEQQHPAPRAAGGWAKQGRADFDIWKTCPLGPVLSPDICKQHSHCLACSVERLRPARYFISLCRFIFLPACLALGEITAQ